MRAALDDLIDGIWIGAITTHKLDWIIKLSNIGKGSCVVSYVKNADCSIWVISEHCVDVDKSRCTQPHLS